MPVIGLLAPLLWLAAGALVAAVLIPSAERDRVEWAALAVGLGLVLVTGVTLLGLLPPLLLVLAIALIVALVPFGLYGMHRRDSLPFLPPTEMPGGDDGDDGDDGADEVAPTRRGARAAALAVLPILLLLLLAGHFRLHGLGYSEFQGDEARAMLLAARLLESQDLETLLWHKKGPLEVLLPAAGVRRGDLRESTARLPFALAGLGVVLAGYALGRRLWGGRAAFTAALVLALDGYLIAFSRIVQYQSVVALCSVLAVWCAWRWYSREARGRRYLTLAALFLAFGTWAHYEAVLAAVPVAYLVASRARRERWSAGTWVRRLAAPVLVGAAVTAAFYVPFVLHPQFSTTFRYIAERRVGGAAPYNKLGDYFLRASFYNASYVVVLMLAGLVAVLAVKLRAALGRHGWLGVGVWLAALAILVVQPGLFGLESEGGERSLAILVFLPVLAVLLLSPTVDARWRMVLLWFAVPFLVAGFLVQKPHTHFYTMVPAAALLVGWGADQAVAWLEGRWSRRPALAVAAAAGVGFVVLAGWYQQQVFLRQVPEYKRVYPEAAAPGYWMPYGDELPRGGYFGFPYRAGWNEVRALFADGTLQGSYDSNEERLITGWYTGGAVRCSENPRYYLVSWNPQDEEEIPSRAEIEQTHRLKATIRVHGQEKLWVYEREPVAGEQDNAASAAVPPLVIDDAGGLLSMGGEASSFLERPLPASQALEWPLTQWNAMNWFAGVQPDVIMSFGEDLALIGADVFGLVKDSGERTYVLPPGQKHLGIVTVWRPLAPPQSDYRFALELWPAPEPDVAEASVPTASSVTGPTNCGAKPTSRWQAGQRYFVAQDMLLPDELAPGRYFVRLRVGDEDTIAAGGTLFSGGSCSACALDAVLEFHIEAP